MKIRSRSTVYDFLCENVHNEKVDNPYVIQFVNDPLIKQFRLKHAEQWHSLLNKNTLKKEVTECYGVVNLVMEICEKLKARIQKAKQVFFFDMCSGKGYTSVVLYSALPEWIRTKSRIIMLDKTTKMNLSHLEPLNGSVVFEHFCIFPEKKNGTQRLMSDLNRLMNKYKNNNETNGGSSSSSTESTNGSSGGSDDGEQKNDDGEVIGICVGVHLCIYLSEIFINVFNQMDNIVGMALSPCCLHETDDNRALNEMCKDTSICEDANIHGMSREVLQYMGWTLFLHTRIRDDSQVFKKMTHDEYVMSDRNNFLVACKTPQEE